MEDNVKVDSCFVPIRQFHTLSSQSILFNYMFRSSVIIIRFEYMLEVTALGL